MNEFIRKNQLASVISIFVVSVLVGLVGLYTENSGFEIAGGIFLLVGVFMEFRHLRN